MTEIFFAIFWLFLSTLKETTWKNQLDTICYRKVMYVKINGALVLHDKMLKKK